MAQGTHTISAADTGKTGSLAFGAYVPQLDAVRGIACLMVLVAHLQNVRGMQWVPHSLGIGGVGIFFALSGFLITRGLLTGDGSLSRFYNRRAARIFPPYVVMLVVLVMMWPGKELIWAATFSFNFLFVTGTKDYFHVDAGFVAVPPVGHVWSLCVEEHFYWLWPPLLLLLSARVASRVAVVVVVATPFVASWIYNSLDSRGYQPLEIEGLLQRLTFTQLTALGLGCLIAIHEGWFARRVRCAGRDVPLLAVLSLLVIGLVLLASRSFQFYCDAMKVPSKEYWQAILGPTSLHLACAGAFGLGLCCAPLANLKTIRYLGRISYGLYLYHLPVYAALGLAAVEGDHSWTTGLLAVALSIMMAAASYHLIEAPILARAKKARPDPSAIRINWRAGYGSVAAVSLVVACILTIVTTDERRPTDAVVRWQPEIPPMLRHHKLRPKGTAVDAYRWMNVIHVVDINGFRRDTPFPAKEPDKFRIVAIGDSYTWGMCIEEDRTYPALLEQLLNERGLDVEVVNCGKAFGQAEDIGWTLNSHVLPLEPDCVVYGATVSDSIPGGHSWRGHKIEEWHEPPAIERFTDAVTGMEERCEEIRSLFRMFVFCQTPDEPDKRELVRWIEQLGRRAECDVISVENYLEQYSSTSFKFGEWDSHPNEECHRIHAEILARHLEPLVRAARERVVEPASPESAPAESAAASPSD